MIEVKELSKSYGDKKAVQNISFTVEKGEILGLLGPNGAGKSTTMNMITGYISMSGGTVSINGVDVLEKPEEAKKMMGYLPEQPPLYLDMTVKEYLNFVYELKKVKLNISKRDHIDNVMETVSVLNVKDRKIKNLSKGYRQRVGFAQALIGKPEVIILDEPTVGLDPNQIVEIREVIKKLKKDHTIIFSTHILSEASEICDRVAIMNKGRIAAIGKAKDLSGELNGKVEIKLSVNETSDLFEKAVSAIPGVKQVTKNSERSFTVMAEKNISEEIADICYKNKIYVTELKASEPTLEKMFAELTRDGGNE